MTSPNVEEMRRQLAVAQAEVDRLLNELERAEWLRDYEGSSCATAMKSVQGDHGLRTAERDHGH